MSQEDHSKVSVESSLPAYKACSPRLSGISSDSRTAPVEDKAIISNHKRIPNFKPVPLRLWFLGFMWLVLMAIISMLVFATYVLPDGTRQVDPDYVIKASPAQQTPNKFISQVNHMGAVKIDPRAKKEHQEDREATLMSRQDPRRIESSVSLNMRNGSSSSNLGRKSSSNLEVQEMKGNQLPWSEGTTDSNFRGRSRDPRKVPGLRPSVVPGWRMRSATENTAPPDDQDLLPSNTFGYGGKTCYYTMSEYLEGWDFAPDELFHLSVPSASGHPPTIITADPMTSTMRSPTKSLSPAFASLDDTTKTCDFTVTITEALFARTPGSPGDFIDSTGNTLTQTPEITPVPSNTPGRPDQVTPDTELCFFRTVTMTDLTTLPPVTVTITEGVVILTRGVAVDEELLPRFQETPPSLEARACSPGGVFTETVTVAMVTTVTATVKRTTTKDDLGPVITGTTVLQLPLPLPLPTKETETIQASSSGRGKETLDSLSFSEEYANPGSTSTNLGDQHPLATALLVLTTTDSKGETSLITCSNSLTRLTDHNRMAMFTSLGETLKDLAGNPTRTTSVLVFADPTQATLVDSRGCPTEVREGYVLNYPHATILPGSRVGPSITASYYMVTTKTTLTDKDGTPTATSFIVQTKVISLVTLTDSKGEPTGTVRTLFNTTFPTIPSTTPTGLPNDSSSTFLVYEITKFEYVAGLVLPTLIATILAIPFRILDSVAKLYHPFHVLASAEQGSPAKESIYWKTSSPWAFLRVFQFFWRGHTLIAISGTLVIISAALVPISVEAIRVTLQGEDCHVGQGNANNCAISLGIFLPPTYILIGLIAIMGLLLIAFVIVLQRQRTGVYNDPWTLSEMTRMSSHPSMQHLLHSSPLNGRAGSRTALQSLEYKLFALNHWQGGGSYQYGVVSVDGPNQLHGTRTGPADTKNLITQSKSNVNQQFSFYLLTIWGRLLLLAFLIGLLVIILTYNVFVSKLDGFFSGETIAVRFFITSVGLIVSLSWSSYFHCVALISPYKALPSSRSRALQTTEIRLSTDVFHGLFQVLQASKRDIYLAFVAFTSLLAEFLPVLLSNVPYRVIQTWMTHLICTWMAVGILAMMIILCAVSFLMDWPKMSMDPSTVLGSMYYVAYFSDEV